MHGDLFLHIRTSLCHTHTLWSTNTLALERAQERRYLDKESGEELTGVKYNVLIVRHTAVCFAVRRLQGKRVGE
jgi:hypothetical protein